MNSPENQTRLQSKVIIVTGAGGGLGSAAAELFAAQGATVVCADIDTAAARRSADRLAALGGTALPVTVDVTSLESCDRMAEQAVAEFGRIDGLFANAGINSGKAVHELTAEEWQRVMDINANGVFYSCRAVLPTMMKQGTGSIVLQSSVCSINGIKQTAAYSASKGAVLSLGYQMAVDYAEHGIRVNCLSPGTTLTPLVEDLYTRRSAVRGTTAEEDLARTAAGYPMNRLGMPNEIAYAAAYLLSDEASFTTGMLMPVVNDASSLSIIHHRHQHAYRWRILRGLAIVTLVLRLAPGSWLCPAPADASIAPDRHRSHGAGSSRLPFQEDGHP